MRARNKIKSLTSVEVFLVLFFSAIVILTLIFMGNNFSKNIIVYDVFALALIFFIILIGSVAIFQFVKFKFVTQLKSEIMLDLDIYKNKLENKVVETSSRIFGFETNYSKLLRKISKDYNTKAKEIENIKKELEIKSEELDRRSAQLEIEFCEMRAEYITNKADTSLDDEKQIEGLHKRVEELKNKYPGIHAPTDELVKILNVK